MKQLTVKDVQCVGGGAESLGWHAGRGAVWGLMLAGPLGALIGAAAGAIDGAISNTGAVKHETLPLASNCEGHVP